MAPANRVKVEGEALEDLLDMLDRLEGLDDVQEVYHNADLPPEPVED
jgi:transcriptional/translational regulatory protein YebC/TACO1